SAGSGPCAGTPWAASSPASITAVVRNSPMRADLFLGTGLAEQPLHLLVFPFGRHRQRGLAAVVARLDVRAALEHEPDRRRVAVGRRPHERGEIVVIGRTRTFPAG